MNLPISLLSDPKLPALSIILSSDRMRQVFQAHFAQEISDCRIERIKYRPGNYCGITYRCDASLISLLASLPGESKKIYHSAHQKKNVSTIFGDGLFHFPELESVVWIFPNDRKLTRLPDLLNEVSLLHELRPAIQKIAGSDLKIIKIQPELKRYVMGRSATVRVLAMIENPPTNKATSLALYGKTYCHNEGEAAWEIQNALWQTGNSGIPEPLAANNKIFWQKEIPGQPLHEKASPEIVSQAARSVAALHRTALPMAPLLAQEDIIQKLKFTAQLIGQINPDLLSLLNPIVERLNKRMIFDVPFATLHGDLHLNNFIVTGSRVAMIDLDNVQRGDPLQDLGSFLAQLYFRYLTNESENPEDFIERFLAAYQEAVPWEVPRARLHWHLSATLIYERAFRAVTRLKFKDWEIFRRLFELAARLSEK